MRYLKETDPEIYQAVVQEYNRQFYHLELIASEKLIEYDQVWKLAKEHKPKMIVAGASAYPSVIVWERFAQIAEDVGAYLMVDMAHYAGLIAGGVYPNPVP